VAKPTKHGAKWRIRWLDEHGHRHSAVFDDYRRAQTDLSRRQVEAEEEARNDSEELTRSACGSWRSRQ
jgi:hypothetical protein